MKIDVLTLFPQMYTSYLEESIVKRAINSEKIAINIHNIRDYSENKHHKVDDYIYGGGAGMLLTPQPLFSAIESNQLEKTHIVFLSPRGKQLNQSKLEELSQKKAITLMCGRYEGIDQRVIDNFVDEEISIGDYILTGGELASLVIIDGVTRLLPEVLSKQESHEEESFNNGLLEHNQYTRPAEYRGLKVPDVLQEGNHRKIEMWKQKQQIDITLERRPELICPEKLTNYQKEYYEEIISRNND